MTNKVKYYQHLELPCTAPSIVEDQAYNGHHTAQKALTDNTCDAQHSYWLGDHGQNDVGFVLDLGCYQRISVIQLRNAYNGGYYDRSVDRQ